MQTVDDVQMVSDEWFEYLLKNRLGREWDRALKLFKNFGSPLSMRVTGAFLYATEQGKVEEVLDILEKHYEEHLQYQHPEIRGTVFVLGINPTTDVLNRICQDTLGLSEAAS